MPAESLRILHFSASPTQVQAGQAVTLSWTVEGNPERVEIVPGVYAGTPVDLTGKQPSQDSIVIHPTATVRPVLLAFDENQRSTDSRPCEEAIQVTEAAPSSEVDILFFVASPSRIAPGERVLLAWSIAGDYRRSEIIGPAEQVTVTTGEVRSWTAPLTQSGEVILRLRVYPTNEDQETLEESVKVVVSSERKQPIEVIILEEQPGADLEPSQGASFTFEVRDPKGNECSWVCNRLAGDEVSFIPREGGMPAGGGIATVSLLPPGVPRLNYVTFEVAAYDDPVLGQTPDSTRASELVSFSWASEGDSPG